jgi:hypothetical protein
MLFLNTHKFVNLNIDSKIIQVETLCKQRNFEQDKLLVCSKWEDDETKNATK